MNVIKIVYWKEVRDMFRDRRVLFGALVMPVLVNLMVVQLFSTIGGSLGSKKVSTAYYVKNDTYDKIAEAINQSKVVELRPVQTLEKGQKLLESGAAKLVLDWPQKPLQGSDSVEIRALYTSDETQSSIALAKFQSAVAAANRGIAASAIQSAGLPAEIIEPIKIKPDDVAKSKGAGESILVSMLPYLLIVFVFAGGMSVASDLLAGEKERGTLETLLTTPTQRKHIAIGKWGALVTFAMAAAVSSVVSLLLAGGSSPMARKMMFPTGLGLSASSGLSMLVVALCLALMLGSLQLLISAWSRNMREAQTYLAVANFIVLLPAVFSQIIGMTDAVGSAWVRWVPILNSAMAIRDTLLAKAKLSDLLAPITMDLTLSAGMLLLVIWVMSNEKILARSG